MSETNDQRIYDRCIIRVGQLEAENEKLRELVVEVFGCARRRESCETCKVNNDDYACVYIMRELGVEVTA